MLYKYTENFAMRNAHRIQETHIYYKLLYIFKCISIKDQNNIAAT